MLKRRSLPWVVAGALVAAAAATAYAFPIWVHVAYLNASGQEVGYRHLLCEGTWISSGTQTSRVVRTSGNCPPPE